MLVGCQVALHVLWTKWCFDAISNETASTRRGRDLRLRGAFTRSSTSLRWTTLSTSDTSGTFCPQLSAARCDLEIFYETKANLKKDQLRTFYSSGVHAMQPGIESLSTPILRLMRKGVTALQNIRLLKWCAEIGITPAWNLLYGFPGEPAQEYARMAELIPSLVHFTPPTFTPIQMERFSPYFDRPAEFGIELTGPLPAISIPLLGFVGGTEQSGIPVRASTLGRTRS